MIFKLSGGRKAKLAIHKGLNENVHNFHARFDFKELQDKIRNLEKTLHGYETTVEQKRKLIATNEAKLNGVNEKLNSLSNSENRIQGANIRW